MIAFIDDHRQVHGVEPICRVLPIAPSTYRVHAARRRDPDRRPARTRRDEALKVEVRRVFEENFAVYGVRKVWRQLRREGFDVARRTVERLMREMGLAGAIRGKPVKTTRSDKAAPCPLDRVNRRFQPPAPNRLWVSDFTYVATWAGFVLFGPALGPVAATALTVRHRRLRPAHPPGRASPARGQALAGASAARPMPASFWTPSNRRCISAGLSPVTGSSITPIAAASTSRSSTPNAWPKRASSRLSAAWATATSSRRSAQRIKRSGGSIEGAERLGRDDQRALQDRRHPSQRPVAFDGRGRVRHPGMGRLVQQSPHTRADRAHPASRGRTALLRKSGSNRHGRVALKPNSLREIRGGSLGYPAPNDSHVPSPELRTRKFHCFAGSRAERASESPVNTETQLTTPRQCSPRSCTNEVTPPGRLPWLEAPHGEGQISLPSGARA